MNKDQILKAIQEANVALVDANKALSKASGDVKKLKKTIANLNAEFVKLATAK